MPHRLRFLLFFDDGEGEDELTNIEATFVRGNKGGFQMIYLYNPPKNPNAPINLWCKKMEKREDCIHIHTDYRDVPVDWLGPDLIASAEMMKKADPKMYRWVWLGEAIGVDELIYYMFSDRHRQKPDPDRRYDRIYIGGDYGQQNATTFEAFGLDTYNAKKLGTEYFEVEWHAGARPTHAVWQGQVWTKEQLYSVCGLGTVTGLLGANCYHTYYPFFPGISQRNWSDEWLEAQNRKESKPKEFRGKEYTLYEAKQRQRQMETAMRAQREKVQMLQDGGADQQEIMLQKAKYQGQLGEYAAFSRKMGLKEERERIYIDGRGRIAPSITNKKTVTVSGKTDDVSSKPVTVTVNGATVTVGTDGTFTKDVTLAEGANTITIVAKDKAGKTTTVTRKVTVDTSAPVIKSVTLTPNPVDCGKTFIIAVEITD